MITMTRRTTVSWPLNERETFRKTRRAAGLSQTELTRETGIPQPRISRWERGDLDLTFGRVMKLYSALYSRDGIA